MIFYFDVVADKLLKKEINDANTGSAGYYKCQFDFKTDDWDGLSKFAVFIIDNNPIPVEITDEECDIPVQSINSVGNTFVGVYGTNADANALKRISTNFEYIKVGQGAYSTENAPEPPAPDLWEIYYAKVKAEVAEATEQAETATAKATDATNQAAAALLSANNAKTSEQNAKMSENNAKTSETNAKTSETNAKNSEDKTEQAMSDTLAMIGNDICPLTDGKIPMQYVPATATTEIHEIASESELTGLIAQRGDLAELIETIGGERVITKTWQCLGDSTVRDNWVVWGTSYAVQAGNATLAGTAENATKINGHRIVVFDNMTDFNNAVKVDGVLYLVGEVV